MDVNKLSKKTQNNGAINLVSSKKQFKVITESIYSFKSYVIRIFFYLDRNQKCSGSKRSRSFC